MSSSVLEQGSSSVSQHTSGLAEATSAGAQAQAAGIGPLPARGTARVLHLLDEAEPFSDVNGGAISRWAANVLRDGDEVIVCPSFDDSWKFAADRVFALPRWKETDPIHPVLYRMPWPLQKRFYGRIFKPLLAQLSAGDVLYVHNRPECASVLSVMARGTGIHIVLHMHNSHLLRAKRGQLEAMRDTPIVFCSRFLQQEIEARFPGWFRRTFVVYNGADLSRFTPGPFRESQPVTIIYCGRVVAYKGAHILLQAMRLLEKRGVPAQCKVMGGSWFGKSRKTAYMRRLQALRPGNTELVGYQSGAKLTQTLREADIFCCPSIWQDPFPLAPIEAMATGLPVVASKVGGIPEALQYGGGLLVPPSDANALADALETLARDAATRLRLREEGLSAAGQYFSWENVKQQYRKALAEIIG